MRKTVHEWLDANGRGAALPSKTKGRRKRAVRPPWQHDGEGVPAAKPASKKKRAATKAVRRKKPR